MPAFFGKATEYSEKARVVKLVAGMSICFRMGPVGSAGLIVGVQYMRRPRQIHEVKTG